MTPDQQNTSKGRWMFVPDGWRVVPKVWTNEMLDHLAYGVPYGFNPAERRERVQTTARVIMSVAPSPPEVREVTEEELAKIIYLAWMGDKRWGKKHIQDPTRQTDRRPVGYFWADVAARAVLRLLAPSDQDVMGK